MPGLLHSLNIGSQSLYTARQGVDTTSHNIANAQTEGYSRQRVNAETRDPFMRADLSIGNGVRIASIQRIHDDIVNRQINSSNQDANKSKSQFLGMQELEAFFSPELGVNIGTAWEDFIESWQNLSQNPEEASIRSALREKGKDLSTYFRQMDTRLREQRQDIDRGIGQQIIEVNNKLSTIAHLNNKIRQAEGGTHFQSNDLRDQRDRILHELSGLININYYQDQDGMLTVHGPSEVLLVDRGHAAFLSAQQNAKNSGLSNIIVEDFERSTARDVTDWVIGGSLGGLLEVRDIAAKRLLDQNNEMCVQLIEHSNAIHRRGFGIGQYLENSGRNFFREIADPEFAAQNMEIDLSIVESTDAISASSLSNNSGNNIIANEMIRLRDHKILGDQSVSLSDYYADNIGILGAEILNLKNDLATEDVILANLKSRKEAISGVSLDEEAANLIRWQTAFTASSKVITSVDEMFETLLNLKR